jgi:acyl-CoA thioester hydrolase
MAAFRTRRRVEFADTDMAGIVHFATFFRYMEAAEHEFLRSRGLSVVLEWDGMHLGFPRVAAACDFSRPARFEDVLEVAVDIERLGKKSISYAIEFFLHGERIAVGKLSTVCCRMFPAERRMESIEIPPGIRVRLEGSGE